ncbi:MAG: hypothetical protein FJ087_02070 [Deltaproteobacteria bacterium]|nr:hypothetical protein [Deltaproteobacteria bacterium]
MVALLAACGSSGSPTIQPNWDIGEAHVPDGKSDTGAAVDAGLETAGDGGGTLPPGQCRSAADCQATAKKPYCDALGGEIGACRSCDDLAARAGQDRDVWCVENHGAGLICLAGGCQAKQCTATCIGNACAAVDVAACPPGQPECGPDGRCRSCVDDPTCAAAYPGGKTLCDAVSGACVAGECDPALAATGPCTGRKGAGACNEFGRCVPCEEVAIGYCADAFGSERPVCAGGECIRTDCTVGGNAACGEGTGYYCGDAGAGPQCLRGCDPAVATGPGSCERDCGTGTPQACRPSHECLCLWGTFPGTGGTADTGGCLSASGSFCLRSDKLEAMAPPEGGAKSQSFVLDSTLYVGPAPTK